MNDAERNCIQMLREQINNQLTLLDDILRTNALCLADMDSLMMLESRSAQLYDHLQRVSRYWERTIAKERSRREPTIPDDRPDDCDPAAKRDALIDRALGHAGH